MNKYLTIPFFLSCALSLAGQPGHSKADRRAQPRAKQTLQKEIGETHPATALKKALGSTEFAQCVELIEVKGHSIILMGEHHVRHAQVSRWLIQEAMNNKFVLFYEGLDRHPIRENPYRHAMAKKLGLSSSQEARAEIYGLGRLLDPLFGTAMIGRMAIYGVAKNLAYDPWESFITDVFLVPEARQTWDQIISSADVEDLRDIIDPINALFAKADRVAGNDAVIALKRSLNEILPDLKKHSGWEDLFTRYAHAILPKLSMPKALRDGLREYVDDGGSVDAAATFKYFLEDYRDEPWADSILDLLPGLPTDRHIVVLVGHTHKTRLSERLRKASR